MITQADKQLIKSISDCLLKRLDYDRTIISNQIDKKQKSKMGQYMTPIAIATYMSGLFEDNGLEHINLLDPGAGIGSLTSAFVVDLCHRKKKPETITVNAYEIDTMLFENLNITLQECKNYAKNHSITLAYDIKKEDFVRKGVEIIQHQLFNKHKPEQFTHVIMNPPYHKIRRISECRELLNRIGIETSNLYTAFLSLAMHLLKSEGQLVAITPRSFCNGPYFRTFRQSFNRCMSFKNIHIFELRDQLFNEDEVLQENIIFHAIKNTQKKTVSITTNNSTNFQECTFQQVEYPLVIDPKDEDCIVHIPTNEMDRHVLERIHSFGFSLKELGIEVSTGKVVDFRAIDYLRREPRNDTVPLIYPHHFSRGRIKWPKAGHKKFDSMRKCKETESLLSPRGDYVLVRRFSSKEEPKRINTSLCSPKDLPVDEVAFENHLNYFHSKNHGLPVLLAKGLKIYLDSTLIDIYFRNFNGHTQVNASDLRMLRYPSRNFLERIGSLLADKQINQESVDRIIEEEVERMAKVKSPDPVRAKKKIEEAVSILESLGLPRAQLNDRSGLTLLALLDLKPNNQWSKPRARMIGITPIMEFCKKHYGRDYAPNTRETFRRQTMHQFVAAGLVVENPDDPKRPTNSPHWCYEIEPEALKLIRSFKTNNWKSHLKKYLAQVKTLKTRYARKREMKMIPVDIPDADSIKLTPGKHNELIKEIIKNFAQRYAPGSKVLYVGDTAKKWGYFNEKAFTEMGINIDQHGKMPDVVLYYAKKDWILLIEAVTSHGPVDGKRRAELSKLFKKVKDKLIYVTAFPDRGTMSKYIKEISWETEVWVAEDPTHLIHFNGERFLGPYK